MFDIFMFKVWVDGLKVCVLLNIFLRLSPHQRSALCWSGMLLWRQVSVNMWVLKSLISGPAWVLTLSISFFWNQILTQLQPCVQKPYWSSLKRKKQNKQKKKIRNHVYDNKLINTQFSTHSIYLGMAHTPKDIFFFCRLSQTVSMAVWFPSQNTCSVQEAPLGGVSLEKLYSFLWCSTLDKNPPKAQSLLSPSDSP